VCVDVCLCVWVCVYEVCVNVCACMCTRVCGVCEWVYSCVHIYVCMCVCLSVCVCICVWVCVCVCLKREKAKKSSRSQKIQFSISAGSDILPLEYDSFHSGKEILFATGNNPEQSQVRRRWSSLVRIRGLPVLPLDRILNLYFSNPFVKVWSCCLPFFNQPLSTHSNRLWNIWSLFSFLPSETIFQWIMFSVKTFPFKLKCFQGSILSMKFWLSVDQIGAKFINIAILDIK